MKQAATWEIEKKYWDQGFFRIAGIDEVGRGAWAGPIVACAYIFYAVPWQLLLYDSKIISALKRQALCQILNEVGQTGIGEVSAQEMNQIGLQAAQYLAYERAIAQLHIQPDLILLDGRDWPNCQYNCQAIIDGDAQVASIAAASIIAKEFRDNYLKTVIHSQYPQFGFDSHVGYGTKVHLEAIKQYGVLDIHRTFYKPLQRLKNKID